MLQDYDHRQQGQKYVDDINLLPLCWFEADRQILLPFSHRRVSEVDAEVGCGVWLTVSLTDVSQSRWSGNLLVSGPGFVPGGFVLKQEEAFPPSQSPLLSKT